MIRLSALGDFIQALGPIAAIRRHHAGDHLSLLTTRPLAGFAEELGCFDRGHHRRASRLACAARLASSARLAAARPLRPGLRSSDLDALGFLCMAAVASHAGMVGDRVALFASARQSGPRLAAHARQTGRAAFDGWHSPDPAAGAAAVLPRSAARIAGPRFRAARTGIVAVPSRKALARRMFRRAGAGARRDRPRPVIVGTAPEAPLAARIREICPSALDLTGRTDLGVLAALARRASLTVGNDTGVCHLAAAAGCAVVVLFSGGTDPARCAPRGRLVEVIEAADLRDLTRTGSSPLLSRSSRARSRETGIEAEGGASVAPPPARRVVSTGAVSCPGGQRRHHRGSDICEKSSASSSEPQRRRVAERRSAGVRQVTASAAGSHRSRCRSRCRGQNPGPSGQQTRPAAAAADSGRGRIPARHRGPAIERLSRLPPRSTTGRRHAGRARRSLSVLRRAKGEGGSRITGTPGSRSEPDMRPGTSPARTTISGWTAAILCCFSPCASPGDEAAGIDDQQLGPRRGGQTRGSADHVPPAAQRIGRADKHQAAQREPGDRYGAERHAGRRSDHLLPDIGIDQFRCASGHRRFPQQNAAERAFPRVGRTGYQHPPSTGPEDFRGRLAPFGRNFESFRNAGLAGFRRCRETDRGVPKTALICRCQRQARRFYCRY